MVALAQWIESQGPDVVAENRVWDFLGEPPNRVRRTLAQVADCDREITLVGYDSCRGVSLAQSEQGIRHTETGVAYYDRPELGRVYIIGDGGDDGGISMLLLESAIPVERALVFAKYLLKLNKLRKLAKFSRTSVDEKLANYLLNAEHSVGGAKAKWFKEALGFATANADDLAKQLVFKAEAAVQTGVTEFGTKYNQVINIVGANGKTIPVVTAWIQRSGEDFVRLVTATPTPK